MLVADIKNKEKPLKRQGRLGLVLHKKLDCRYFGKLPNSVNTFAYSSILHVFGVSQWYQWYTNIVQGFTNGTNGNTICTNGNAKGTIGSPNGTIGANGKPMVPLVSQITNGTIGRTPNIVIVCWRSH